MPGYRPSRPPSKLEPLPKLNPNRSDADPRRCGAHVHEMPGDGILGEQAFDVYPYVFVSASGRFPPSG